jgi:hypothetical protein
VRRWRLVIGGPAILLLMGVVVSLAAGAQEDPIDQGLTGPHLAEALGLEPVTENVVKGCNYFAEAGDVGYCLDSAVRDGLDPSQLYVLLNKEPFNETEARIAQIQDEIWRLGSDPAVETDPSISARLHQLAEELGALCATTDSILC